MAIRAFRGKKSFFLSRKQYQGVITSGGKVSELRQRITSARDVTRITSTRYAGEFFAQPMRGAIQMSGRPASSIRSSHRSFAWIAARSSTLL